MIQDRASQTGDNSSGLAGGLKHYVAISSIYSSKYSNVFKAFVAATGKPVVLKTVNDRLADGRGASILQKEFRILSGIQSNHVPRPIECPVYGNGFCLVREYSEGVALAGYLKEYCISVKEFLHIAMQIMHVLSDIHDAGIIHKDINPGNIIYNRSTGKVDIIDFGSATEFSRERPKAMETGIPEGCLLYISPEQTGRMNHVVDFRSDFYSLGVTFFEMLSGRHPFESESNAQIIHMHLAKTPPWVRTYKSDIPEMLSRLVARLMAKMPEDRYQNTAGICFDLAKCLASIESGCPEQEFELGLGDYCDRFEIPEKTYGRNTEIEMLETSYAAVSGGGKELLAIAGHSGIGKSTLVGELHRRLAGSNGIFIRGKYDQYRPNIPYVAISQALAQFCDFVLSENSCTVDAWRTRIGTALKKDGRLLIDRIPRLALLAGDPELLPELSPLEERTRFKVALQELLAAIASADKPLVMFLDDMHLAGGGSFELILEIMGNEKISGFLVLACYRDNEVDERHPLILCLDRMAVRNMNVRHLSLGGLDGESAARMIADTLHRQVDSVAELAAVVCGKTGGNPLYVRQFLKHCHTKHYFRFNRDEKAWTWDMEAIRHCEAGENVVDFLVRNLDLVRPETKRLLSLGACIGQTFTVGTLAILSGREKNAIVQDLKQAVDLDFACSTGSGAGAEGEDGFRFSHDRFQQAFHSLLSDDERSGIHFRLVRHFEESGYGEGEFSERQFTLADSYSKAYSVLSSKSERRRAAEILLKAARAASLRSSFGMALNYLELVTGSLQESGTDDDFAFGALAEYHATLCSLARYPEADLVYVRLESLAKEPICLTDSCCLQAISLSNRGRYRDVFMLGTGLLAKLGVQFPEENLQEAIVTGLGAFYSKLGEKAFPGVESLPGSDSSLEASIAKILNRISTAGLFYNAFCAFWAIITNARRVLENGYTRDGLPLYGSLTLLLIPFRNDYRLSYNLARGAMKLAEKNGYRVFRMYHLFSLINSHWFEDWKTGMAYARESCRGNTEFGDFEFACFSYFTTQQLTLDNCQSLDGLVEETTAALATAERHGNLHAKMSFISFRQFAKALVKTGQSPGGFDDGDFSEAAHLDAIADNRMALCFFYILRALLAVIFADFDRSFEFAEKAIPSLPSITGFYFTALHKFLHSLSICKRIESGTCNPEETAALGKKLSANQKWFEERAADAPMNFSHLFNLLEAERKAAEVEPGELLTLYERAMSGARENGKTWHYALACELAARRFFVKDTPSTAAHFLGEACRAWDVWGAKGKVEEMRREFIGHRLFGLDDAKHLSLLPIQGSDKTFDFNSLIQASQAISRETRIDGVLGCLMNVLLENAGAQDIYYVIERDGAFSVLAECHAEGGTVIVSGEETRAASRIPVKVVNYAARSRETLVLDNAAESDIYGGDEYIKECHCKSVMCMPIVNKGELKGLLYLENNLIAGAFDMMRIDALNTISTQLAISLENAYLFANLQRLVDDRTRELRDEITVRKDAERRLEHMANHDMLTSLPNRRMFLGTLDRSIKQSLIRSATLAVLFIDLDNFKAVNDRYGHEMGDLVLVTTARRLTDAVRDGDTVSRLSGDEFVLILENVKTVEEIETICGHIITSLKAPITLGAMNVSVVVTSSIGISLLRVDGTAAEDLISMADSAMYIAKNHGKNQFIFHTEGYKVILSGA